MLIFIKTIGILFSGPMEYLQKTFCKDFTIVRLFGQLSAILWNIVLMWIIRKLIKSQERGMLFKDLYLLYEELGKQEYKFLLICFILPLVASLWPIFSYQTFTNEETDKVYCYYQSDNSAKMAAIINIDFQKILIWDAPVLFYFFYSIYVLYQMKQVFYQTDYELNVEVSNLIKQLMVFPLITFVCTIGYTAQQLELLFVEQSSIYQIVIDTILMSLWGLLFSFQFISLHGIKARLGKESFNSFRRNQDQGQDQEVTLTEQNWNQLSQSLYYYSHKHDYENDNENYINILNNKRQQIDAQTKLN